MSDNIAIAPSITSLVVPNPENEKLPTPWKAPFVELLGLLKIIDVSQPTPDLDGQRFCFQPSQDLSEISRTFLSISASSTTRYDIDLGTIRMVGSDPVPASVTTLLEYANHVLRRTQLFRDRLIELAVIDDSACFLQVDMFTCPLCSDPLISCVDCDSKIACSNEECHGSLLMDCERCFEHNRMACHACLAKNDTIPAIVCCPVCQIWCCREDAEWCAGLVVEPAPGTKELAELSNKCEWDSETIVRSHPLKPGSCRLCTAYVIPENWTLCHNIRSDTEPDHCPALTPSIKNHRLRTAYCPECIEESPGCRCACGLVWICGTCLAIGNKTIIYPFLITCPRCGVGYCTDPHAACGDYIEICRGCKGVILCNNCQEEEELPGETETAVIQKRPKQVALDRRCSFCEAWSCFDCCASERTAVCFVCEAWFCYGCVSDLECRDLVGGPCGFCSRFICKYCRPAHLDCPRVMMMLFRQSFPDIYDSSRLITMT